MDVLTLNPTTESWKKNQGSWVFLKPEKKQSCPAKSTLLDLAVTPFMTDTPPNQRESHKKVRSS